MAILQLYDAANSPCARRVRMILLEKGISFEIHWMNLGLLDQKTPDYLALNPNGLVPTVVHNGHTIFESNVINEYLETVFPEPRLMPSDDIGKAEVRMWLAFELSWAPLFRDVLYETFGKQRIRNSASSLEELEREVGRRTSNPYYLRFVRSTYTNDPDESMIRDRMDVLDERMQLMEDRLSDEREWLVGDHYSLADISLIPRIDMFSLVGVNDLYERFPRIGAWAARVTALSVWRDSDIHPEDGSPTTLVPGRDG